MKFLSLLPFLLFFSCSRNTFNYYTIENAMPPDEQAAAQMKPVAEHLYRVNLARYGNDSTAVSETAKQVGQYMIEAYKRGQFCEPWQRGKKRRIKTRSL